MALAERTGKYMAFIVGDNITDVWKKERITSTG